MWLQEKEKKPIQEQMKNEKPRKNFTSLENEKIKEKIVKKTKVCSLHTEHRQGSFESLSNLFT